MGFKLHLICTELDWLLIDILNGVWYLIWMMYRFLKSDMQIGIVGVPAIE